MSATNTKELIEELRVQANQHPGDVDLLQFDIAATALEQLQARCAEYERERDALVESRGRYAKYFNAFCWFLKNYSIEPLHSDNSPKQLEDQLHSVVIDILDQRNALAAHVERYKSACEMLYHWHDTSDGGMVVDGDVVRNLWELESTTPQQSLAKHDAEVARKAFVAGANWQAGGLAFNQPVINREANQYIEQLKENTNE
jgi:hypothetical protein